MTDTPLTTPARPRKRSRAVALTILGAAAFALAGCREEAVEAEAFPDLGACKAVAEQGGSTFSSLDCDIAFQEAQTLHAEAAPRYESQEVCEELHGVGNCGSEQQATGTGGGSIFMPLIAGYLIGSMLGGGRQGMAASQPLYRTQDGRFTNAAGTAAYSSNTGRGNIAANQFTRPAATAGQPPMTRATAAARGGFGSSGSTRPAVGT
ncbi:DUF1190 domain-containing protein [Frigidibacter sp.]|uniref:DUF1190 domain-containing protein n=1 Tax=Frigidibacter sp. TaxID=2586418 RepID=UPI00273768C6|nr:DUF1190 domain-containing protein [Frigidibacter sp.]MDP3340330.1 DUF1190 domain-containing protein [Frigidibacter sp.]